jgi:hypothetical protein
LLRFESGLDEVLKPILKAVEDLLTLKYNEIIMRYLLNKLDHKASLAYQRPESLEEIPGKVTASLMREHKFDVSGEGRGPRSRDEGMNGDRDTMTSQEEA